MAKRVQREFPPLDPEVRQAGLRILEHAFGEYGVKGGTLTDLRTYIEKEIVRQNPQIKPGSIEELNYLRSLAPRFYEYVTGEQKNWPAKKELEIKEKFITDSIPKYLARLHDELNK